KLVQDDAQAVDVAAGVNAMAFATGLFGTHVARSARPGRSLAEIDVAQGQAEVGDNRIAFGVEQDVGRLDVAVDQAALMGMMQGLGGTGDNFHRLLARQPGVLDSRTKVNALDELRNDKT